MTESRTLCVSGKRYFHRYIRKEVDSSIDLLSWLERQEKTPRVYWQGRDGTEIVAFGSVLNLTEVPKFDAGNDSPATFWGGHAFFPTQSQKESVWGSFPKCGFFLPQYQLEKKEGKIVATIQAINGQLDEDFFPQPSYFAKSSGRLNEADHLPCSETWKQLIQHSLNEIKGEILKKVVVARRSTFTSDSDLHPLEMLARLKAKGSIRFAFQFGDQATFIGATPERLYKREGLKLYTEAVAGTRQRGKTEEEDALLHQELLDNPKERREFDYVKESIENSLLPLCSQLKCDDEDGIIKTPNVQHLHNPFIGQLLPEVTDEAILSALHPTAAMGGFPRKSALEYLLEHEPFERGWYASPIGFVSQENAEFAVGIRSALVEKNQIHLFAGTGIVEGSVPEKEWEELDHKTFLWRSL